MSENMQFPSIEDLEQALLWEKKRKRRSSRLVSVLCVIATLVAAAVLAAALWVPIIPVYGDAMEPTYQKDDILAAMQTGDYAPGDVIAFYHNNTIHVRRIIAGPGSVVELDENGQVTVDGAILDEPYLAENAMGQCDIALPYTVPDGAYFVMGDNRAQSIDSRSSVMGCVSADRIVGKVILAVWPVDLPDFRQDK